MGMRRRTRRRALVAGAAIAHHRDQQYANQQAQAAPAEAYPEPAPQPVPEPADPLDEIEHLARLHESGALTDEEFASAKSKILGI
jgi:hypothetical protein